MSEDTIVVTGASGQLGGLVVDMLLARIPAARIRAGVRDAENEASARLKAAGIETRVADYDRPDTLASAFAGVQRLLLISSSAVGGRVEQHRNVIAAATSAGVRSIAYTSMLHADVSPISLAEEHRATERMLSASGVPYTLLRNGWYTENYGFWVERAVKNGLVLGSAGHGRIATAARSDYAEAAATVVTTEGHVGRVYELAGDRSFDLAEFAATVAAAAKRPVEYRDLPSDEFRRALEEQGVPDDTAGMLADIDLGIAAGALNDGSRQLSALIGRPTTPVRQSVERMVAERS